MRDRLIELVKPFVSGSACEHESGSCELTNCRFCNARSLADNILANGVIVPPCKVGDTVYVDGDTWSYFPIHYESRFIHSKYFVVGEIVSIIKTKKQLLMKIRVDNSIHTRHTYKRYTVNAIGVTVFLTKEEVEKALKEREKV